MQPLSDEQLRVLGCLAEKEAAVPDAYPMTLNALRQACNQSTSRDPVVAYDDLTVQRALDGLKALGLVRFVHPSHGERTTRFRHVIEDALGIDRAELALLAVLVLRGPQTAAELRTRTERLHPFRDPDAVDDALARLAARDDPLVVELPRLPGHHQTRWAHLLAGPVDVDAVAEQVSGPAPRSRSVGSDALGPVKEEVAELRARVERLERELGLELGS